MASRFDEVQEDAAREGFVRLPSKVRTLLEAIHSPARLIAHLHLVHDAAHRLMEGLHLPGLDDAAVRFGAAIHDIGKALDPSELAGPGSTHEAAGERWLLAQGVPAPRARFARTHGCDVEDPSLKSEDLWVIAADKLWKGRRIDVLEERIVGELARSSGVSFWDAWSTLSARFEAVAADAERRLAWQGRYSI